MAANAFKIYDKLKLYLGQGLIDFSADSFKLALFLSTSNCEDLTNDEFADLTNEVATGNGYTAGGVALTSVTWTELSGVLTFDFADPAFVASGGSITARFAVVSDDTTTGSPPTDALVGYSLLDNTPLDVTVTDGNTLTAAIDASGMFLFSGGS